MRSDFWLHHFVSKVIVCCLCLSFEDGQPVGSVLCVEQNPTVTTGGVCAHQASITEFTSPHLEKSFLGRVRLANWGTISDLSGKYTGSRICQIVQRGAAQSGSLATGPPGNYRPWGSP